MKRILIAIALTTLTTTTAAVNAGPLRKTWIGADARWVAHVDFDACRDSQVGKFILEHREEMDIEFGHLDDVNIDPLTDFYNITVYGVGKPEDEGVIIVQMNDKIDAVIEHARKEADDFSEMDVDGRTLYRLDDGHMFGYVHKHESGKRTIILSGAVDRVLHAIEVIEGDRPDLADAGDAAIDPEPRKGAIVYACADGAPWLPDGDNPASQVIKLADGISAQAGEYQGEAYGEVAFSAKTPEDAKNISEIVTGVVALGKLMASQDDSDFAQFRSLVNGVKVKTNDSGIRINISMSADDLIKFARMAMEHHDHEWNNHEDEDSDHHESKGKEKDKEGWDKR